MVKKGAPLTLRPFLYHEELLYLILTNLEHNLLSASLTKGLLHRLIITQVLYQNKLCSLQNFISYAKLAVMCSAKNLITFLPILC